MLFAFYGVCLDSCDDKTDWTVGGALGNAGPFIVAGVAMLIASGCLFMVASSARSSVWRAGVPALLSTLAFAALFALFLFCVSISEGLGVIAGIVFVIGWVIGTSAVAYRTGLRLTGP